MPKDLVRRVLSRSLACAALCTITLSAPQVRAQDTAASSPAVADQQVQSFFNGIELEQSPAQAVAATDVPLAGLDADLDPALGGQVQERAVIADAPPTMLEATLLVLATLGLLGCAVAVIAFAMRELRRDKQQRQRNYRRRVPRHDDTASNTPATAA